MVCLRKLFSSCFLSQVSTAENFEFWFSQQRGDEHITHTFEKSYKLTHFNDMQKKPKLTDGDAWQEVNFGEIALGKKTHEEAIEQARRAFYRHFPDLPEAKELMESAPTPAKKDAHIRKPQTKIGTETDTGTGTGSITEYKEHTHYKFADNGRFTFIPRGFDAYDVTFAPEYNQKIISKEWYDNQKLFSQEAAKELWPAIRDKLKEIMPNCHAEPEANGEVKAKVSGEEACESITKEKDCVSEKPRCMWNPVKKVQMLSEEMLPDKLEQLKSDNLLLYNTIMYRRTSADVTNRLGIRVVGPGVHDLAKKGHLLDQQLDNEEYKVGTGARPKIMGSQAGLPSLHVDTMLHGAKEFLRTLYGKEVHDTDTLDTPETKDNKLFAGVAYNIWVPLKKVTNAPLALVNPKKEELMYGFSTDIPKGVVWETGRVAHGGIPLFPHDFFDQKEEKEKIRESIDIRFVVLYKEPPVGYTNEAFKNKRIPDVPQWDVDGNKIPS